MSKYDFLPEEFAMRHGRVRRAMEQQGIELLIVIHPTNIQYLIGTRTKSYQEFQCLLFPLRSDSPSVVLTRLAEVAEYADLSLADHVYGWGGREPEDPIKVLHKIMSKHAYLSKRTGLEIPYYYLSVPDYLKLRDMLSDAPLSDATLLVEKEKLVKSPAEIRAIRRAAQIADTAMSIASTNIVEGRTECQVAGAVYQSLLEQGGDSPASPINLISGERSCYPHGAPTERGLCRGDAVNIEFGGAYRRYCVTIGRQFSIGAPSPRLTEIYQVAREASDACISKMRPGVRAVEPHNAAKEVIAKYGLDSYRLHTTGYGIAPGYPPSWGESIQMFADSAYVLEAGMLLSVEPPVFVHQERMGTRIIDNVLITDAGPELMSRFSRDLIIQ